MCAYAGGSTSLPLLFVRLCYFSCRAKDGETNWDAVIDAEMARRKLLEDSPIPCSKCRPALGRVGIEGWAGLHSHSVPALKDCALMCTYNVCLLEALPILYSPFLSVLQQTRTLCCLTLLRSLGGRGCAASTCLRCVSEEPAG